MSSPDSSEGASLSEWLPRASFVDLPKMLAGFHRRHPAVEITLSEANSDRLLAALQDGELDVAIVAMTGAPPPGIATHVVADEAAVAAVSRTDPLVGRAAITVKALHKRALISLPQGTELRASLDGACAKAGFQPHIVFEASDPDVLAQFAIRGFGVAILPESIANAYPTGLYAIAITRPGFRVRLRLAWKAEGPTSPAARALIAHTRAALEAQRG